MRSHLCTRTSFTLPDGRVLSCVLRHATRDDEPLPPLYYLGLPRLAPRWWLLEGEPDFGPLIALDDLPKGLQDIAQAMAARHAYHFHPTVFDPSEPYL